LSGFLKPWLPKSSNPAHSEEVEQRNVNGSMLWIKLILIYISRFGLFGFTFVIADANALANSSRSVTNYRSTAEHSPNFFKPRRVDPFANPRTITTGEVTFKELSLRKNQKEAFIWTDLPIVYNDRVKFWIRHFQTHGRGDSGGFPWFRSWLEKATRFMPFIQRELSKAGLPQDLGYMVMIESGFSPNATSSMAAVGPWQFIRSTAERYGLTVNDWLDERRDWVKSTRAAIRYLQDLYREFECWYLVAAAYNMGENGLRRSISKAGTKNFWELARQKAIPAETSEYVPKILAALLISKAPALYGFKGVKIQEPFDYEVVAVPGGTSLTSLAQFMGVNPSLLIEKNAELTRGRVPERVSQHLIRVPRGKARWVAAYHDQDPKLRF
jgi:membrane-bound lytic murein transglycosylase D